MRTPGIFGARDTLRLILLVIMVDNREAFVEALGGPDAPIGANGRTASDLADALENVLEHLTNPGTRVIPADSTLPWAWEALTTAVS